MIEHLEGEQVGISLISCHTVMSDLSNPSITDDRQIARAVNWNRVVRVGMW